jgi:hypothetical protein
LNADSRMQTGWVTATELGFAWGSAHNPAVGRPYPFTRVAVLNPNAPATILSQPDLWNSAYAYLYPSVAVNARGHVGGVIDALGGSQGTGVAATLIGLVRDDISAGAWSSINIATSTAGTQGRWGNYNGSARHAQAGNTWLVAGKHQVGGTGNEFSRIINAWLMRVRDDPFQFTDAPLTAGVTIIKAVHVTELRARIDAERAERGLSPFPWSTNVIVGATIRAVDITDMREALRQAYVAASLTPPTYSDAGLAAGMMIRAAHITELRSAALALP